VQSAAYLLYIHQVRTKFLASECLLADFMKFLCTYNVRNSVILLAPFCWCFTISKFMILVLFLIVILLVKVNNSSLRTIGSKTDPRGTSNAGEET